MEQEEEWSGTRARIVSIPEAPTAQGLEEHLLTHWPFRNWCDHCVRGRGKSGQHREVRRGTSIPIVGIDYMWMTSEDDEGGDESLRGMPILALADQESGWVSSWLVPKKGAHWYAIKTLHRQIEDLGYVQENRASE